MTDENTADPARRSSSLAWRLTRRICCGVIAMSVISCVLIAAMRSEGLTSIRVNAMDARAEPRDHGIPLIKQREALPDYEIVLLLTDGRRLPLGSRPDTSAASGLEWRLSDPVSINRVASIRLQDRDQLASDTIAEVQYVSPGTTSGNYQFVFETERSFDVGVSAFFATPIGIAIASAFGMAVLLMLLSALSM